MHRDRITVRNTASKGIGDMEEKTEELLCEIYRNLRMGSENLCTVTPRIRDKFMMKEITGQLENYSALSEQCGKLMREISIKPKEPSAMKKMMARSGIMMNTAFDKSERHIAEMIVRGTDMGADALETVMERCREAGCSESALSFCDDVIRFERRAADSMAEYR